MKAVVITDFGPAEHLVQVDQPSPELGRGQVFIKTEAVAVGFQDVMVRSGALAAYGFQKGHIPGGEVAGRVVQVGESVNALWHGRRVWAFVGLGGGYAELVAAPVTSLVPLPDTLSPAQAVAVGGAGAVAHFALRRANFQALESILIRGAGGPIGLMAVQLAASEGGKVIAVTASTSERGCQLKDFGATHVLDRQGNALGHDNELKFDVILDVVAGASLRSFVHRLNVSGRLLVVGAVGGFPPEDFASDLFPLFQRSLQVGTFSANSVPESARLAVIESLFEKLTRGQLRTPPLSVMPLEEAAQAHALIENGKVFGKLVLEPS